MSARPEAPVSHISKNTSGEQSMAIKHVKKSRAILVASMLQAIALMGVMAAAVPATAIACEMPSSQGREDLYGHTSNRSGIDQLNPEFRDRVAAMMDAANAELGGKMTIYSGYRSVAHQQRLWDQGAAKYPDPAVRRKWIAKPGGSMHNYGLAVDLRWNGGRVGENSPANKWMKENLGRFGLTRPMSYEHWHVEPIGARANKTEWMGGSPSDCSESFENEMEDVPPAALMMWEIDA